MEQEQIEKLEQEYFSYKTEADLIKLKMDDIKKELVKVYEEEPDHEFTKVKVYPIAGRIKIDWQGIAETYKPDRWMIEDHTTQGKPSVAIKLIK